MTKPDRIKKLTQWTLFSLLATLATALFCAVGLTHALPEQTQALRSLPLVSPLSQAIPPTQSPFLNLPWDLTWAMAASLMLALGLWRLRFHWGRFKDEERERDLQNL